MITDDAAASAVAAVLREVFDVQSYEDTDTLQDLGLDELDTIELIMSLEDELQADVDPYDRIHCWYTVSQLITHIIETLS